MTIQNLKHPILFGVVVLWIVIKHFRTTAKSARTAKWELPDGTPVHLTLFGSRFGSLFWKVFLVISGLCLLACFLVPAREDGTVNGATILVLGSLAFITFLIGGCAKGLHDDSVAHSIALARGEWSVSTPDLLKAMLVYWVIFGGGSAALVGYIFAGIMTVSTMNDQTGSWLDCNGRWEGEENYVAPPRRSACLSDWINTSNTTHKSHP
jgi:hypothetical protein